MKKLNCFIASAFGYEDIDNIFDNSIVQVLKELKINYYRVDRINHNSKIDLKIIELIKKCDFGIVDLTYARPSVYYEAGFIEGQNKNVIYISREDHFKPKINDVFGNERIHFDLITQNIIAWKKSDNLFKSKLKKRILLIAKPIINKVKISQTEIDSREIFKTYSLNSKIELIEKLLRAFIIKKKYDPLGFRSYYPRNMFENKSIKLFYKVFENIKKTDYDRIEDSIGYINPKASDKLIIIICNIKPITTKRIEVLFPSYTPISDKIFQYKKTRVIFLDSIDSSYKMENYLKKLKLTAGNSKQT